MVNNKGFITWTNLFLVIMLGVALYSYHDLYNRWYTCRYGYVEEQPQQFKVQLITPAHAGTRAEYLESVAASVEERENLPKGLLRSICRTESNWNPNAIGQAAEVGVCQIKATTVAKFCPDCTKGNFYLSVGSKGPLVKRLQIELIEQGYIVHPTDKLGVFGESTRSLVRIFQEDNGLTPDGVVGPKTWKAIFNTPMPGQPINDRLLDPVQNIKWAGQYLVWLRNKLGTDDPMVLAAAYNGGDANMTVRYMLKISRNSKEFYNE